MKFTFEILFLVMIAITVLNVWLMVTTKYPRRPIITIVQDAVDLVFMLVMLFALGLIAFGG